MDELNKESSFGGQERVPDPRDYNLGSVSSPDYSATFMPDYAVVIEDQKQLPDCGANAGVYLKEIIHGGDRLSVEYLWDKIKLIDGIPVSAGTDMLSIMKALNKSGVCLYDLLPTNSSQNLADFTNPSKITPTMDSDALGRCIGAYAFTFNPTLEELKQAIYTHKAVILLMRVGKEWWRNKSDTFSTWQEKDILPLTPWTPPTSGHFVVATGYDENYIYGFNEWSDQWGKKGMFYFGTDYLSRVVEIGTAFDMTQVPFKFTTTLKVGSKGLPVKMLQLRLKIPADGIFGQKTKVAVQNFQTLHHLVADGIVGKLTNDILNTL